jgi:molybdopterin converting factor small subunit
MSIRVLYFARSRELTGTAEESIAIDEIRAHAEAAAAAAMKKDATIAPASTSPTGDASSPPSPNAVNIVTGAASGPSSSTAPVLLCHLLPFLLARHSDLVHLPLASLLLAYNHEMVPADDPSIVLRSGDEVALIQPISGG